MFMAKLASISESVLPTYQISVIIEAGRRVPRINMLARLASEVFIIARQVSPYFAGQV